MDLLTLQRQWSNDKWFSHLATQFWDRIHINTQHEGRLDSIGTEVCNGMEWGWRDDSRIVCNKSSSVMESSQSK